MDRRNLDRKVVDQAEWIFDITSGEIWFILYDFAAVLHEAELGICHVADGYFQHGPEGGTALYEQIDVVAVEADHVRRLVCNLEPKLCDIKGRCGFWIFRLNQDIRTKLVCHVRSLPPLSLAA
jgi:hypothetical protein